MILSDEVDTRMYGCYRSAGGGSGHRRSSCYHCTDTTTSPRIVDEMVSGL